MKWIEFSRLMQAVEYLPPNRTVNLLVKEIKGMGDDYAERMTGSNTTELIEILSLDLAPNFLASKKALKWITKSLEVFEEEVEQSIYIHGDIGEAVYHL